MSIIFIYICVLFSKDIPWNSIWKFSNIWIYMAHINVYGAPFELWNINKWSCRDELIFWKTFIQPSGLMMIKSQAKHNKYIFGAIFSALFRFPRWFMSIEWVVWKFGWKTTQMLTIQHVFYWQINEFKFALAPRFTSSHFSAGALFVILKSALNNIYTRAQAHTFNEYRLFNNKFKLSRTILIQQQLCQIL